MNGEADGPAVPGDLSVCDPRSHLCVDCLRNADCGSDSRASVPL